MFWYPGSINVISFSNRQIDTRIELHPFSNDDFNLDNPFVSEIKNRLWILWKGFLGTSDSYKFLKYWLPTRNISLYIPFLTKLKWQATIEEVLASTNKINAGKPKSQYQSHTFCIVDFCTVLLCLRWLFWIICTGKNREPLNRCKYVR